MASNSVPKQYRKAHQDFSGGLMSRPSPLQIPVNKFHFLQNAILNDHDILEKVQGYTLDGSPFPNTAVSFIRFLINYNIGDTTSTIVCAASDQTNNSGAVYNVDLKQSYGSGVYNYIGHTTGTALFTMTSAAVVGSGTSWLSHLKAGDKIGTGALPTVWYTIQSVNSDTSITLTTTYVAATTSSVAYMARILLSVNAIPTGVVFNNNLIISNGSETPMETNNTTLNKLLSANWKAVKILELHKNRVFGANWSASPSGLIWTAANDETTVDATSIATIFANDNGQTVALKSFANSLIVFKDNGNIYQVVGEFDQSAAGQPAMIRKIDTPDNMGLISGQSICAVEDNTSTQGYQRLGAKLYFLSETGIHSINSYMQVQKVSWDIQPTVSNLILKSTASATKQYSFASKSQWDAGTINSLSDTRLLNGISTYFDSLSLSTASPRDCGVSTFLDSSNNVHTAYVAANGTSVRYNKWLASDNSNTDVQVYDYITDLTSLWTGGGTNVFIALASVAIGVASNGNAGIASKLEFYAPSSGIFTFYYVFSELVSGSWVHTAIFQGNGAASSTDSYRADMLGIALTYNGTNDVNVIMTQGLYADAGPVYLGYGCTHISRVSGTWGTPHLFAINDTHYIDAKFVIDGSGHLHAAIATGVGTNWIEYWKSTDAGVTWTAPAIGTSVNGRITPSGTNPTLGTGSVGIFLNAASDPIIVYNFTGGTGGDVGKTVRYNTVTHVSSYVDSTSNYLRGAVNSSSTKEFAYTIEGGYEKLIFNTSYTNGTASFTNGSKAVTGTGTKWSTWVASGDRIKLGSDAETTFGIVDTVNSNNSITLLSNYTGTTNGSPAAYLTLRTNSVTGASAVTATAYRVNAGLSNVNNVVAAVCYGASAGEIRLRRVTLFGQWYSSDLSDSTLTAWDTYEVTNPTANGNTITYEVGVNTSSPITDDLVYTITPGAIISLTTNTYVKARISFTLSTFAASSVQSLGLNYSGTGVDAKLPFGFVHDNEMYLSVTTPSAAGNNEIIYLDRTGAWGTFTLGTCAMARYNQQIYLGDSAGGNIYKFRQGYNFNGSTYSLIAIGKEDLLGSLELQKEIYKVYVIYETQLVGNVTFSYRLDNFLNPNSSNTTGWVDTTIDQTQGSVVEILGMGGQKCSSIQFKVQQDDKDVQVGIVGFIVLYDYYNLR